jgi:hypothetical protein
MLFEKLLFFLINSLAKKKKAVSLQALDCLETQITERNLTLKIQENFEWVIGELSKYNENLMLHAYFDFLTDFIKAHCTNFTQDNLVVFLNSLVNRISKEL